MKKGAGFVKYFRWVAVFFALALVVCWCKVPVYAENTTYKTVKVGYYPAKGFQEGDGAETLRSGYGYEYLQKVASYTGWRYAYVSGSWDELYEKLKNGEIDLLAGVSYEEDRADEMLFPEYEMLQETYYIYKDSDDTSMQSGNLVSYSGKKIGVVNDEKMLNSIRTWMQEKSVDISLEVYENLHACAEAFNSHEIDGFVSADNIVSGFSGITPVELVGKMPYYLCVANGEEDTLQELNAALSLINGQDALYLAELKNKYTADTSISIFLSRQEKDWMDTHSSIKVGYLKNYLPYSDAAGDIDAQGLMKDVLNDIFEKLPGTYMPDIQYLGYESQANMIEALKEQKVDLIFPVSGEMPYAEQNGYQQSSPVMQASVELVYAGKYSENKLNRIAVNQNNVLQCEFTKLNYPDAELVGCNSIRDCLQAVKKGEADSTVIEALRAVRLVDNEKNIEMLPLTETCAICFGVDYGNSDLLRLLNHGLSMLGEGYSMSHAYQYVGDIVKYTAKDYIFDHIWIVFLLAGSVAVCVISLFVMRYRAVKKLSETESRHNQALQDALMKAHQASYAKQLFLNNISHDIRTPLNAILGIMAIDQKCEDPEKKQENYQKVKNNVDQLLGLLDNMLEISSLESGQFIKKKKSVDFKGLLELLESRIHQLASEKKIAFCRLTSGKTSEWPLVYGIEEWIQEVLQHILENAIKYTQEGGSVSWEDELCHTSATHMEYHCKISDSGIGMNRDFLAHIFEPFSQERYDARTTYTGAGLGMSIVKTLIEQMKGTIEITSEPGKGTVVTVRLPLEPYDEQDGEKSSDKKLAENVSDGIWEENHEKAEEDIEVPDLTGKTILLVEDNALNVEIASFMLEEAGATVLIAQNGKEAVEQYRNAPEFSVDAILMDIMMPVMNGYEAADAIRSSGRGDSLTIPIIATTACTTEKARKECQESGMNDFMEKPLQTKQLVEMLLKLTK